MSKPAIGPGSPPGVQAERSLEGQLVVDGLMREKEKSMSATRDKTQKTVFVYSNLYQLYRKGLQQAKASPGVAASSTGASGPEVLVEADPGSTARTIEASSASAVEIRTPRARSSQVLKSEDLQALHARVEPYNPPELLRKRFRGAPEPGIGSQTSVTGQVLADGAIESLKRNLQALNELHARLRFMLQELEEHLNIKR